MLQKLNARLKGVVAWIIVILIAFTFTLFGIDYYLQSRNISDNALEIDGVKISKHEFDVLYRRARQQIDPASLTKSKDQELKNQIMQDIVNKQVALSSAEKNGFFVDKLQANMAILSIPQFQQDGKFSESLYQEALSASIYTPASFQQEVRQGMLMNQQRFAFIGTAFALPNEVNRFIKLFFQQRDFDYLVIPFKFFVKEQQVTASEEKKYYEKNQDEFFDPEEVSVNYILLSLSKERQAQQKNITKQQIKSYYENNQQNFIEPPKWQVSRIFIASNETNDVLKKQRAEKISKEAQNKPNQFDALKKRYTDDKFAITNEKKLPWITVNQGNLIQVLMNMKKIGDVSKPVKTKYGYEIYQVKGYKPKKIKPLDEVESMIRLQLVNSRAEKAFSKKLETLTELTFQTPDTLEPAAKAVSEPVLESSLFTRKGGRDKITKNQHFVQAAFSQDVLALGNNSEQVQIDGDTVVFLRIKQHKKATKQPFSSVEGIIKNKIQLQKAKKFAISIGQSIVDGKITEEQLANEMKKHHLIWKKQKNVTRESDEVPADIKKLAFSIQSVDQMIGKEIPSRGYVVVKLISMQSGEQNAVDVEQRNALKQQLESNLGVLEYGLYINGLIKKAKLDKHI